jgi:hypothetical protein
MTSSVKDRLAAQVESHWVDFQSALSDKRKYPVQPFREFLEAARRYAELTKSDPLIHRKVVVAVNGLTDFLQVERKRVRDKFSATPTDWSASCSAATILTSRATNRQGCRRVARRQQ